MGKAPGATGQEAQRRPEWPGQKDREEGQEVQVHRLFAEAHAAGCVPHPGFSAIGRPRCSPQRNRSSTP